MATRDKNDTLREIEENQAELKASLDEARRLAEKAQTLLDRHRKEVDAEAYPSAAGIRAH